MSDNDDMQECADTRAQSHSNKKRGSEEARNRKWSKAQKDKCSVWRIRECENVRIFECVNVRIREMPECFEKRRHERRSQKHTIVPTHERGKTRSYVRVRAYVYTFGDLEMYKSAECHGHRLMDS